MGKLKDATAGLSDTYKQMEVFNDFIKKFDPATPPADEQKQLQDITSIVEAAVGLIAGVFGAQASDDDPTLYNRAKKGGACLASSLTSLSAMASGAGGVFGYVSKHMIILYAGVAGLIVCGAATCICMNCVVYKRQQDVQRQKELLKLQQAEPTALQIQSLVNSYTKARTSPEVISDKTELKNEAKKCLNIYRHLPKELQVDEVYDRMISLLAANLPKEHKVREKMAEVRKLGEAINLTTPIESRTFIQDNSSSSSSSSSSSDASRSLSSLSSGHIVETEAEENSNDQENSVEERYKKSIEELHALFRKKFSLKRHQLISFVEEISTQRIPVAKDPLTSRIIKKPVVVVHKLTLQGVFRSVGEFAEDVFNLDDSKEE